ncbi:predicted protein [Botrytis cinerea T4]|uniref:Uncharacterized protein n=1 Tax=Botryotinia fuckeliana (strain T4) TaxID=999810 RepID=G2YM68_BOTF4|nr:predicted protein [Botrytis cinerea T4]
MVGCKDCVPIRMPESECQYSKSISLQGNNLLHPHADTAAETITNDIRSSAPSRGI